VRNLKERAVKPSTAMPSGDHSEVPYGMRRMSGTGITLGELVKAKGVAS
jgi:hypothetical protein